MVDLRSQLILKYPQLDERVSSLFEKMSASRALREAFVRDPAGVAWESVFDRDPGQSRTKLSSANRLLYCFLADTGMRRWASEYTARVARRFDALRNINDPVERKREFLLRVDRNEVAREFASALARVAGPALQTAVVDSEGKIDPIGPLAAVAGPVAAAAVILVAFVGLFVVFETEFAVDQHNAFSGPEPGPPPPPEPEPGPPPPPEPEPGPPPPPEPEPGPPPPPEPEPGPPPPPEPEPGPPPPPEPEPGPPPPPPEGEGESGEFGNWLGLTRSNLKQLADILSAAMTESARDLDRQGALRLGADELQGALNKLSVEGRL